LLPAVAQAAFLRVATNQSPSYVVLTGYGIDDDPPGCTGGSNTYNLTQQTDSGSFEGRTVNGDNNVVIAYRVDTREGNSGCPVIHSSDVVALGVHNGGPCNILSDNEGTGFEHLSFADTVTTFQGDNCTHVDRGHPATTEDGTIFSPYDTVAEGVSAAGAGGVLSIVKGTYNEAVTISKALDIETPVGEVTIGQ
jgi:hypothetical protein